jgi:hypothetical protein
MNHLCHDYYHIPEHDILPFRGRDEGGIGEAFHLDDPSCGKSESFSASYDKMRVLRWEVFFFGRDILWNLANWKTERLDSFVDEFKPDIIFACLACTPVMNKLIDYMCVRSGAPLALYSWDDVYLLTKHTISPFYWIKRSVERKWIRRSVASASLLYGISQEMCDEYSQTFNRNFSVLTKGSDFFQRPTYEGPKGPVRYVYAGNIGAGRWNILGRLAHVLQELGEGRATLDIYTLNPVNGKEREALEVPGVSVLRGGVAPEKLPSIHRCADVLVHVDAADENNRRISRLSFSTKIVDYFAAGRCVLSVGGPTAATEYLRREDAAIVAYDDEELLNAVKLIDEDASTVRSYAKKAWDCGARNHQKRNIQRRLLADFCSAVENNGR